MDAWKLSKEEFEEHAVKVKQLTKLPLDEDLLIFYNYKQATEGPVTTKLSNLLDGAKQTETKIVEMSAFNCLMTTHVLQQVQHTKFLYDQKNARVVTIDGFEYVPENDEKFLKKALAHQPISVAIEDGGQAFQLSKSVISRHSVVGVEVLWLVNRENSRTNMGFAR